MGAMDMGDVARVTAVRTARAVLQTPLRRALRAAGGQQAASDVIVHDGHLNDLVMRMPSARHDVIVGVSGESRHADLAEELEWGGLDSSPKAWVRQTAGQLGHAVTDRWSAELTTELDKRCR